MGRIDSASNPRVVGALHSLREGTLFPLEGSRAVREALDASVEAAIAFHVGALDDALRHRLEASGTPLYEVTPRVLDRLSDLPSTRGLVVLAAPPQRGLGDLPLPAKGTALLLDGVQDPSNVGAMLRTAEAFGVSAAVLTAGSARPFSARAFRASAGSALRLPLAWGVSPEDARDWARGRHATLAGAEAHGGEDPSAAATVRPLALVIGSEGHGISPQLSLALDLRLTIPLQPSVESLNAAAAAAVLLYALSPKTSASNR